MKNTATLDKVTFNNQYVPHIDWYLKWLPQGAEPYYPAFEGDYRAVHLDNKNKTIYSYCEGDFHETICADNESYELEVKKMKEFYANN